MFGQIATIIGRRGTCARKRWAATPRSIWRVNPRAPLRRVVRALLGAYMRLYHRLELRGREHLPRRGPAIVLVNHASLLDVPALMVLDPYPDTIFIAKASLFNVPVVGWLLGQWDAS